MNTRTAATTNTYDATPVKHVHLGPATQKLVDAAVRCAKYADELMGHVTFTSKLRYSGFDRYTSWAPTFTGNALKANGGQPAPAFLTGYGYLEDAQDATRKYLLGLLLDQCRYEELAAAAKAEEEASTAA